MVKQTQHRPFVAEMLTLAAFVDVPYCSVIDLMVFSTGLILYIPDPDANAAATMPQS
jgi:hypothetical protein